MVFLAQKKSSTSGRDSLGLLVKTVDLFREHYLSIDNHRENVDIFLFHTGDFDVADLEYLENIILGDDLTANTKFKLTLEQANAINIEQNELLF